jgi:hypothetical protein
VRPHGIALLLKRAAQSKYPHRQSERIVAPALHVLPPRTQALIAQVYGWFYKAYYPDGVRR